MTIPILDALGFDVEIEITLISLEEYVWKLEIALGLLLIFRHMVLAIYILFLLYNVSRSVRNRTESKRVEFQIPNALHQIYKVRKSDTRNQTHHKSLKSPQLSVTFVLIQK